MHTTNGHTGQQSAIPNTAVATPFGGNPGLPCADHSEPVFAFYSIDQRIRRAKVLLARHLRVDGDIGIRPWKAADRFAKVWASSGILEMVSTASQYYDAVRQIADQGEAFIIAGRLREEDPLVGKFIRKTGCVRRVKHKQPTDTFNTSQVVQAGRACIL